MKSYLISIYNLLVVLSLLVIGCKEEKAKSDQKETYLKVKAEPAVSHSGVETLSYSGVVEEKKKINLSFFSAGTISEILVHEGQPIKQGQLVARLDAASARNAYQIALLEQQKAQDAYDRLKPMHDNNTLPPIKMVEAETGLKQAKANAEIAKKNVEENNLYAPANGTIGKIHVTSGMNVGPGIPVLDLLNINSVYIKVPVPENEISKIKEGSKATVSIPAISKHGTGEVKEIGVSADILSHTYPVRVEVDNPDLLIKPGMVCSVSIQSETGKTGLIIYSNALQKDVNGNQYVYVVDNKSRAEKRLVKTISLLEKKVLIEGEIKDGELVIVSGQERLMPQKLVEVIR